MLALNDNFGGAAAKSAGTAAGQFKILKNSIGEFQESLGALLLPVIMQVLPKLQMLADWAQANPEKFMNVAKAVTAVSVAVLAMNIAVNAHPLIAIGSALLTLAGYLVFVYNKFETFRNVVNGVFNSIMATMQGFVNAFNSVINVLIRAYNLLNFGSDVPYIPQITLPRMGGGSGSAVSGGGAAREGGTGSITPSLPSMPSLPPTLIGGGGSGGGGGAGRGGGGGGTGAGAGDLVTIQGGLTTFGNAERIAARSSGGVTINVTGGMSTSAEIGQSVLNSLLAYQRTNGPLDLQIAS
jgi:phage-related protein